MNYLRKHWANNPTYNYLARIFIIVVLLLIICPASYAESPKVAVIPLHGMINQGMADFVSEELNKAWQAGYRGVILDIDTTSGFDDAATAIKSSILSRSNDIPIAAYIHDHATGPGSLIPLSCKIIAMSPAASLGNAPTSNLKSDFKSTAEATGRNSAIAIAFISADNPIPSVGISNPGSSLTLTTKQAQASGFCDIVAADYPTVLNKMGLNTAHVEQVQYSAWTSWARWIVLPWATILLLAIGLALVIFEMFTMHSWGIAGIIGGIIILLIFAAHITVGNGSYIGILLFLIGIALLLFETHILPGHGISAAIGLILITVGMFYALGGPQSGALYSLAAALFTTTALTISFFLYLPKSKIWTKLGQPMRQTASAGYVSSDDYTEFLGKTGVTTTLLRPSGTAEIEGVKLPVVSEGEFIPAGSRVQVIVVQGNRIVVRQDS